MTGRVIRIERVSARGGVMEEPVFTKRGYELGDPRHGKAKHHAGNAVHVCTLEEAADLIGQGFSLRMGAKGKRASLIAPRSLRILRDGESGPSATG